MSANVMRASTAGCVIAATDRSNRSRGLAGSRSAQRLERFEIEVLLQLVEHLLGELAAIAHLDHGVALGGDQLGAQALEREAIAVHQPALGIIAHAGLQSIES